MGGAAVGGQRGEAIVGGRLGDLGGAGGSADCSFTKNDPLETLGEELVLMFEVREATRATIAVSAANTPIHLRFLNVNNRSTEDRRPHTAADRKSPAIAVGAASLAGGHGAVASGRLSAHIASHWQFHWGPQQNDFGAIFDAGA